MIVKIFQQLSDKKFKRVITFLNVTDRDFEEVVINNKTYKVPNEYFRKKFKHQTGKDWKSHYGVAKLGQKEVEELKISYEKKVAFYSAQINILNVIQTF